MASIRSISDPTENTEVGGDILGLITSGMYDTPLASIREYIQNSADAYASVGNMHGRVDICTDPANLCLIIRDYGPGLNADEAVRALLPVARSQKAPQKDRGFRGIGRLGGLAFADRVKFVTRAEGSECAFHVTWNGARLRQEMAQGEFAADAIRQSVTCGAIKAEGYPRTFFEVEVSGVARHAAPQLLNREKIRRYVSEVCPVPFGQAFSFASNITSALGAKESLCELQIHLDHESNCVKRRVADSFNLSESRADVCSRVELFGFPSIDGDETAALCWIAHSSYLGAIHKTEGIRGERARVGNLQVGDESSLDSLFDEERFNRWCIGEVHILDRRILPNARRDYFEPSPHLQNLESKLSVYFNRLSAHCRKASLERNKRKKLTSEIEQINEMRQLASSEFIDQELALGVCSEAIARIIKVRTLLNSLEENDKGSALRVQSIEGSLIALREDLQQSRDRQSVHSESLVLEIVFRTLVQRLKSNLEALQIIEEILREVPSQK